MTFCQGLGLSVEEKKNQGTHLSFLAAAAANQGHTVTLTARCSDLQSHRCLTFIAFSQCAPRALKHLADIAEKQP